MRIIYLAKIDLDQETAERVHVIAVCAALARLGHRVLLVAPRPSGPPGQLPIPAREIPLPRGGIARRLLYPVMAALVLARAIADWRPQAIYERDVGYDPGPALICRLLRVAYLVEVNGFRPELVRLSGGSRLGLAAFTAVQCWKLRRADVVAAVADSLREKLIRTYRLPSSKVVTVENGVDLELFRPMDREACRLALGVRPEVALVGWVGSRQAYVDLNTLLQAVVLAGRDLPSLQCWVVGRPELTSALATEEPVRLVGQVPHHQVPIYLNAFDLCLLSIAPGAQVTANLKLREYLACGRPVVAAVPSGNDFVPSDPLLELAARVPPGDARALADAIVGLLRDPLRRRRLGEQSRQAMVAQGGWLETARQVGRLIEDRLECPAPSGETSQNTEESPPQATKSLG